MQRSKLQVISRGVNFIYLVLHIANTETETDQRNNVQHSLDKMKAIGMNVSNSINRCDKEDIKKSGKSRIYEIKVCQHESAGASKPTDVVYLITNYAQFCRMILSPAKPKLV